MKVNHLAPTPPLQTPTLHTRDCSCFEFYKFIDNLQATYIWAISRTLICNDIASRWKSSWYSNYIEVSNLSLNAYSAFVLIVCSLFIFVGMKSFIKLFSSWFVSKCQEMTPYQTTRCHYLPSHITIYIHIVQIKNRIRNYHLGKGGRSPSVKCCIYLWNLNLL